MCATWRRRDRPAGAVLAPPALAAAPPARPAGVVGWVLFDWAAQPFYTLVLTFLFAPYFANVFIADPVRGQALWGYAAGAAGFVVALAAPVLGAIADAGGRRKPWVAAFSVLLILALMALWLAVPGRPDRVGPVLIAFVAAFVAAEFATVFTNAMMPSLVPPRALGRLSGIGWSAGYVGGLVSLVIATGLLVADPVTGRTMLGLAPLLPLDPALHEGERLIGPLSALWYALFMVPFFLFTPDRPAAKRTPGRAVRDGLAQLADTIRHVRRYGQIVRFLVARMLYVDGLGAIFAFGGIYAASLFGWSAVELGLFGVILTLAGALGAAAGGVLDDRYGARAVILGALAGLIAAAIGIVSIGDDRVLFVFAAPTAGGGRTFATAAEQLYLAFAVAIGVAAGPLQAASRSLLARMAPRDMMTEFFGLFAFSGKITAFAAPLLVGAVTAATGSQRAGIAAVLLFLVGGLAVMATVRPVVNDGNGARR